MSHHHDTCDICGFVSCRCDKEEQAGYGKRMEVKVGDWIKYKKGSSSDYIGNIVKIDYGINGNFVVLDNEDIILEADVVGVINFYKKDANKKMEKEKDANEKMKEFLNKEKVDMVNHPKHYTFGTIEVITVIDDWGLGFYEGQVIKYVGRAKHKGNELEDLRKAQWYLNRKIEQLEKEK